MNTQLRRDADQIIAASLKAVMPDEAVHNALKDFKPGGGKTIMVAVGKAAWQMAKAAIETLGNVDGGIVITKYGHVKGELPRVVCFEAGHPVPDENSFMVAKMAIDMVDGLRENDTVLFLLSGGGSALFELPLISPQELQDITGQLLAGGAGFVELNPVRKRLSGVKGGRFALHCAPARVFSVILSDIVGDPLDMIASGPAYPDTSTCAQAEAVVKKYGLKISNRAVELLSRETPKKLDNVEAKITGSVRELCGAALRECRTLGYETVLLTDRLCCEAREAGSFLASILKTHECDGKPMAFVAGGETVVHVTGHGLGGRNQEIALSAAAGIRGLNTAAVFSLGSDGTDGPTDAAGGYVDGTTAQELQKQGWDISSALRDNDAYHALAAVGGLIITGPTGTNVNDVSVALLRGGK